MKWHTVAEGIAQARREKGVRERRDIPQEEIADAVGVTVAAYSRWEKGQRVPNEEAVRRLAEYFGVSPAYLRYGIGAPSPADVELINPALDRRLTAEEIARARAQVAAAHASKTTAKRPARKRGNGKG